MNTTTPTHASTSTTTRTPAAPVAPVRHVHRARDFGVGYGNSSGYATTRRYVNDWGLARFRFA